ncbi:type 1 fimbrial major subunit FimA [Erwinia amylovora]
MKIKKIVVAMGSILMLCSGLTNAATTTVTGGTIHFKGKLVAAPCSVSTDSDGQIVNLGEYTTHHFNKRGVMGTEKPFQIKLEDCDITTQKTAAVAFQGRQDTTDDTLLAVDSSLSGDQAATATGVGIRIKDSKSKYVPVDGSKFSSAQTLLEGENVLNFMAQYKSTGVATAGMANADATFIMQYE